MGAREAELRRRAGQLRQAGKLGPRPANGQLDRRVQRVHPRHRRRSPAASRAAAAHPAPGRQPRSQATRPRAPPAARTGPRHARRAACARCVRASRSSRSSRFSLWRNKRYEKPTREIVALGAQIRRSGRGPGGPGPPRLRARASRCRRAPCSATSAARPETRSASTCPPWKPMLTRLEAGGHQWSSRPAAGSTISVSTPTVAAGCMKATREPRMPIRGCSSISASPACLSAPSVASMSLTW